MKKIFVVALVFVLAAASSASAAYRWRAVTHVMAGTEQHRIAEEFCETVKTLSQGELIIEPFSAGVLFPVFESLDNLTNGVIEMAMVYSGYWLGKDPGFMLTSRLGCPVESWSEGAYIDEKLEYFYIDLYKKFGIQYLGHFYVAPVPEQILSIMPVNSLADLKGVKMRCAGVPARFYAALGANVMSVAAPEIYTAFQTKNVDAMEYTHWDEHTRMNFHEVITHVVDPAPHVGPRENLPLVVNQAKWDALPQHLKDIVIVARDQARYKAAMVHNAELKAREQWRSNPNITIISFSPEELAEARAIGQKMTREECEKTDAGRQYLEVYRNALWELGYREAAINLGHGE